VININIKKVAEIFDITIDTIRYYEKVGVIPPVTRKDNGHRDFTTQDMNWVFLAKSLRNAGVSIESMTKFTELSQATGEKRLEQKNVLNNQLKELDEKLKEIKKARDLLDYKIETYDDHIAQIEAGHMSPENAEKLWEVKYKQKSK